MTCPDRTFLGRLADGELSASREHEIRRHLAGCGRCTEIFELLKAENGLLVRAFSADRPRRSGTGSRGIMGAAVLLLVVLLGAIALRKVYRELSLVRDRVAAQRRTARILERPVRLRAEGIPLEQCLGEIGRKAGVAVRFENAGRPSTSGDPRVHIALATPIRLRSVLCLLSRFYGLTWRVEGDAVVVRKGG